MAQSVSGQSNGISSESGLMAIRLSLVSHAVGLPACERVLRQFLSMFSLQMDGWLTQLLESCGELSLPACEHVWAHFR